MSNSELLSALSSVSTAMIGPSTPQRNGCGIGSHSQSRCQAKFAGSRLLLRAYLVGRVRRLAGFDGVNRLSPQCLAGSTVEIVVNKHIRRIVSFTAPGAIGHNHPCLCQLRDRGLEACFSECVACWTLLMSARVVCVQAHLRMINSQLDCTVLDNA